MKMVKGELLSSVAALVSTVGILWVAATQSSTGMLNTLVTRLGLVVVVTTAALAVGLKLLQGKEGKPKAKQQVILIGALMVAALACLGSLLASLPEAPTSDPNELAIYYKEQILRLRGDIEARDTTDADLRKRALQLADLIGKIDESQLEPARKIIQHEYRGWAFLMGVSSFGERPPEYITAASRIDYATKAVAEFDLALNLMAEITRDYRAGEPAAIPIYEWMTGPSEDLNRIRYLKAIALAVIARAGGGTSQAAIAELSAIEPTYLASYPAENNPDLAWALGHEWDGGFKFSNGGDHLPVRPVR